MAMIKSRNYVQSGVMLEVANMCDDLHQSLRVMERMHIIKVLVG